MAYLLISLIAPDTKVKDIVLLQSAELDISYLRGDDENVSDDCSCVAMNFLSN